MSYFNTYYAVQVNAIVGTGSFDGFIDRQTVEQYMAAGSIPSSLANSTAKVLGNLRYKNIIQQLEIMGNIIVTNAISNGATINSTANTFVLHFKVEQGDNVLRTTDELSSNGYVLHGYQAIERCVARALNISQLYTQLVYDPTSTVVPSNGGAPSNTTVRVGQRTIICNVAALTNSLINASSSISVYTAPNFVSPKDNMYPGVDWPIIP